MSSNDSKVSRRKFLTGAAAGLAVAGMSPLSPALALADDKKTEGGPVIERKLGKSGVTLPIVSMGVMNANNPGLVQASFEQGMRHFDTAAFYQFGRNEQMVGKVINKMKVREQAHVGTKIFADNQRDDLNDEQIRAKLMTLLDGSLSRLKFDYVDLLYIHSVSTPDWVKNEGILQGLAEIKKSGKARQVGISTHTNMAGVINEMLNHDIYDAVLTSINFTMVDDTELLGAIEKAAKKGIGVIAMKTMAGGSRWPNPESRANYSGETVINAAMKWVMRNENITTSIPGFDNFDHMKQNFAITQNLEYTEDEKKFLTDNKAIASIGFCRQCRKCLASCPSDVDVPTLMRTHMYAAQYANFQMARLTLDNLKESKSIKTCADCNDCIAKCANQVDIKRNIGELKTIYA